MAKNNKTPVFDSQIGRNKKAFFDYEIIDKLECGIVLAGPEVKSLRLKSVNFEGSFVQARNGELLLYALNIGAYEMANRANLPTTRLRKLLAHKREIRKFAKAVESGGLTIVPLKLYWSHGKIKVEIGLARGKSHHDKRASLKEQDTARDLREYKKR